MTILTPMVTIQTNISVMHIELIKTFFDANDLPGVSVHTGLFEIRGRTHEVIEISYNNDDIDTTASQITFMAYRHLGVNNMLEDYIMKCGINVWAIPPATIRAQELDERDEARAAGFEQHMKAVGLRK